MKFNIVIKDEDVIKKLKSLDRNKGQYLTRLVKEDIWKEGIEGRLQILEAKCNGVRITGDGVKISTDKSDKQ